MLDVDRYDPTFRLDPPPPEQSHHTPHVLGVAGTQGKYGVGTVAPLMISVDTDAEPSH